MKLRKKREILNILGIRKLYSEFRHRWWSKTKLTFQRELEYDEKDRRNEHEGNQYAMKRERRREDLESEIDSRVSEIFKVTKEQQDMQDMEIQRDVEMGQQNDGFVVTRIMTREERIAAMQQLGETIPTDQASLWEWEVKWAFLDDVTLNVLMLDNFIKENPTFSGPKND